MYKMSEPLQAHPPFPGGKERDSLNESIDWGWISSEGPFVKRLEAEFVSRIGREYGITVRDGSVALDIAIAALGIGRGEEIILPTFTGNAPITAIARTGAIPVLIDSDPLTWNMDVTKIEAKITPKTRAILVAHTYGLPVDMAPVLKLAEQYGLPVIENAADLHGQTYQGRSCGSFGTIAIFSFYHDKLVTAGEGGIILTDRPILAERCRELRDLSLGLEKGFFSEESDGNFRMNNLQAALGFAYLERLPGFIARKREIGRLYTELLSDVPGLQLPVSHTDSADNFYRVYGFVLGDSVPFDAREMMYRLAERGIETRPFFCPVHERAIFSRAGLSRGESFPVAENLFRRGLKVPSGTVLKNEQILRAARVIKQILSS